MLISDWQVQPCRSSFVSASNNSSAIVWIGGEIQPEIVVGEEKAFDAAALDLIDTSSIGRKRMRRPLTRMAVQNRNCAGSRA